MLSISPIWVICALEKDEFSKFEKKLEQQFYAISSNEMANYSADTHKWWKITNVSSADEDLNADLDQQGHPCDVPAYDAPVGTFDLYKQMVVYYGKDDCFTHLISIAQKLNQLHTDGRFMNGAQIIPYGLCVVTTGQDLPNNLKEEINKLIEPQNNNTAIQKIFFQGDQNKNAGNRDGYDSLLDDKNPDYPRHHIHDLSVQIISHLALAKDNIGQRTTTGDRLLAAGGYSLVFEKEAEKARHASSISKPLFKRFYSEEDDERWLNDNDAVMTTDLKHNRDWKTVYMDLISGFKNEQLTDICPKSTDVSPWSLVTKYMIPLYYNKFIRSFIKILYKNVYDYSTNSFIGFEIDLENGFSRLTKAHLPENEIKKELMTVWAEENTYGAVGLKQCQRLLDKTTEFFEAQKRAINNMKNGDAPDKKHTNFPSPQDFPMRNLGKYQEFFEKYWNKNKTPEKKEISADSYGNNLLTKLTKVLKYHPIPLSLIARSILTALFLPFAVFIVLRIIDNNILNTEFLEEGVGLWILSGSIFVLCILWGLFKYAKLVLGKIKSLASDYIGWFLYKTQKLMFEKALERADNYYEICLKVCNQYNSNLNSFINAEMELDGKQIEGFEQTMFQCDVAEYFDNYDEKKKAAKIIKEGTIIPKIEITRKEVSRRATKSQNINYKKETEMEQLYVDLTRSIINMDPDKDVKMLLENGLFPNIPDKELKADDESKDDDTWKSFKLNVFTTLQSKIRSSVLLYVGSVPIKTIADLASTLETLSKTLIKARVQPSVQSRSSSAFASLIFPNETNSEKENWYKGILDMGDAGILETTGSESFTGFLMLGAIGDVDELLLSKK